MKLSAKQEKFCQEYLVDLNATQAAIRCKYSEKTAKSQGQRLLTHVDIQQRISALRNKVQKRTEITQDRVVMEIAKVAFADIGLVCNWNEEGKLTLKAKKDMGPEGLAALNMIQSVDSFDKDGNVLSTKNSFKMNDKLKALELLGKYLGMLDGSGAEKSNPKPALERLSNALSNLTKGTGKG